MRILLLQDHHETGGAARAAGRFASGLRKLGVEVAVAAGDGTPGHGLIPVTGKPKRGWGRVRELFQKAGSKKKDRERRANEAWEAAIRDFRPDLIWIHNLEGAFKWGWNLEMVSQAFSSAPLLWTLHDMWTLGDGSSYFPEGELRSRWGQSPLCRLRAKVQGRKCLLLTPSVWLRDLVRSMEAGRCEAWRNPLDLETFRPGAREKIRQELGLRHNEMLLLAAAENLADPRKGIDLLAEAWQAVRDHPKVRLGLVGRNFPDRFRGDPRVHAFGVVSLETRMAELMAAADLFVHPAKVESYGLVLEEAQACGTPVLAFAGGGVGETLQENGTGWILPDRSPDRLAEKLGGLLQDGSKLSPMRKACRKLMEERHSAEKFASKWAEVTGILEMRSGEARCG